MTYGLDDAILILGRTPGVVRERLIDLPEPWARATEGAGTWSPFDVVGHLIHAERADWIPRAEHLLAHGESVPFPPFDREAMFEASKGRTLPDLLTILTTAMEIYSTYDAKARFSEILRKVRAGKRVVVTHHGRQVAEIRPIALEPDVLEARLSRLEGDGIVKRATLAVRGTGGVARRRYCRSPGES